MDFIVFTSKLFSAQEEETETEDSDDSMIKLIVKQTNQNHLHDAADGSLSCFISRGGMAIYGVPGQYLLPTIQTQLLTHYPNRPTDPRN